MDRFSDILLVFPLPVSYKLINLFQPKIGKLQFFGLRIHSQIEEEEKNAYNTCKTFIILPRSQFRKRKSYLNNQVIYHNRVYKAHPGLAR